MWISYIYIFLILELDCKNKSKYGEALYCELVSRPKYVRKTQDLVHAFTTCIEHIMGSFSDQIDECINYSWPKKLSKESKQYNYM